MFDRVINNDEQHLVDLLGSSIFVDVCHSYIINSRGRTERRFEGLDMYCLFKAPIDFVPEVAVRIWRV